MNSCHKYNKYIVLSDLHIVSNNPICRKDNLVDVQWGKLEWVFNWAAENNCNILMPGDIHAHSNSYYVLNNLISILKKYKDIVDVYCVFGQHDMKYRNTTDTNLQILINSGLIKHCSNDPYVIESGISHRIWGADWQDSIPIPVNNYVVNILVIHSSISPAALFKGQNYIDAKSFLQQNKKFNLIACGDVHRKFSLEKEGRLILNSGPLLRREADQYNFENNPGFWFIDLIDMTFKFIEIPCSKAEDCLKKDHIERKKIKKLTSARADTAQFLYELKNRMKTIQILDIQDRMRLRIKDETMNPKSKKIIESLLNGERIDECL